MTDTTKTADKPDEWVQRFGTLLDVTPRKGTKGDYLTFKMNCGSFEQIGAAFDETIIASLKAAVGKKIWVKGPMEPRQITVDGETRTVRSFKAIYFKDKSEEPVAADAADPALKQAA